MPLRSIKPLPARRGRQAKPCSSLCYLSPASIGHNPATNRKLSDQDRVFLKGLWERSRSDLSSVDSCKLRIRLWSRQEGSGPSCSEVCFHEGILMRLDIPRDLPMASRNESLF